MKKLLNAVRLSKKLLLGLSVLTLIGCRGTVTIPNVEICADESQFGAFCKYSRSEKSRSLDKAAWDLLRGGQADSNGPWFCMSAPSLGKYQKFVEEECNFDKNCIDEVTAKFENAKAKFRAERAADMKQKAKKNPKLLEMPDTDLIPL